MCFLLSWLCMHLFNHRSFLKLPRYPACFWATLEIGGCSATPILFAAWVWPRTWAMCLILTSSLHQITLISAHQSLTLQPTPVPMSSFTCQHTHTHACTIFYDTIYDTAKQTPSTGIKLYMLQVQTCLLITLSWIALTFINILWVCMKSNHLFQLTD